MPQAKVEKKRKWVKPQLTLYGDMAALTQTAEKAVCNNCKVKIIGLGDDFSDNISTFRR